MGTQTDQVALPVPRHFKSVGTQTDTIPSGPPTTRLTSVEDNLQLLAFAAFERREEDVDMEDATGSMPLPRAFPP